MMPTLRVRPPVVSHPILFPDHKVDTYAKDAQILQKEAEEFWWNLVAEVSHT